nr:MAG: hypothetical protein DIU78_09360 [Pseudomonadota bacterium]
MLPSLTRVFIRVCVEQGASVHRAHSKRALGWATDSELAFVDVVCCTFALRDRRAVRVELGWCAARVARRRCALRASRARRELVRGAQACTESLHEARARRASLTRCVEPTHRGSEFPRHRSDEATLRISTSRRGT